MPERTVCDRRRFVLRTLAPVHVGSGKSLLPGIDIVEDLSQGRTYVLDMDEALHRLDAASVRGQKSLGVANIVPLLQRCGVDLAAVSLHVLDGRWGGPSTQLREALRDAGGRALIPGSSLKGAIRTAVLAGKVKADRNAGRDEVAAALDRLDNRPKFAAKGLESRYFRPMQDDPKYDVFRRLAATDAFFASTDLAVLAVVVNSPSAEDPRRLKDFSIAVEALAPGLEAEVTVSLDGFLTSSVAEGKLGFGKVGLTWEALGLWTGARTKELLEDERKTFLARGFRHAAAQLERIRSELDSAPQGSIPLRLGWGIGWLGTTGGLATEEQRIKLLSRFEDRGRNKMAKLGPAAYSSSLPFPKSRRILPAEDAWAEHASFGWVLLEPAGERGVPVPLPLRREGRSGSGHTGLAEASAPVPPAPARVEEPQVIVRLRAMRPQEFAGRLPQLVKEAEGAAPEVRAEFARLAVTRVEEAKMAKNFRDKSWFGLLKTWKPE